MNLLQTLYGQEISKQPIVQQGSSGLLGTLAGGFASGLGQGLGGGYFGAEAPQFNLTLPGNYGYAPESTQNMGLLQGIAGRRLF